MNEEKIKELWWKARIGYNEQNCDPEVLAKFAELIVRECVSKCEFYNDSNWGPASECIAQDIKQHFRVEL